MKFVIVNAKIERSNNLTSLDFVIDTNLHFTKKIWYGYGGIPLFDENINLIIHQLEILNKEVPTAFKNKRELFRVVKRMLNKNKLYRSGYVKMSLFSTEKGTQWIGSAEPCEDFDFPINSNRILLQISEEKKYSPNKNLALPYFSQPIWQKAEINEKLNENEIPIITNELNEVCEIPEGNIFCIKDSTIYFAYSTANSGYMDSFYPIVKKICQEIKLKFIDDQVLLANQLPNFDEVICIGEQIGIIKVAGIGTKRYIPHYSDIFYRKINEVLMEMAR